MSCDLEPIIGYNEVVRKARKDHKCCECRGVIKKGERYQHASGVFDRRGFSAKTCMDCKHLICEIRKDSDECLPIEGLIEEIQSIGGEARKQYAALFNAYSAVRGGKRIPY